MQDLTIKKALCLAPRLPHLDREVLLSHVLGQDRVFLMAHGEEIIAPQALKRYQSFIARAKRHEPIAYITGVREFYGRNFFVGPGVLIPRPETELIVETTMNRIKNMGLRLKERKQRSIPKQLSASNIQYSQRIAVIDVGTGSGAIIISVVKEFSTTFDNPHSTFSFFAVDSETAALRYARKNAKHHRVATSIRFMKSDLLSKIEKKLSDYDAVVAVANLPYLSRTLYRSTAPNVKHYEPRSALESGNDGLAHYHQLLRQLKTLSLTVPNIRFIFEISPEQAKKIPALLSDQPNIATLEIVPDLAGKARIIIGDFAA